MAAGVYFSTLKLESYLLKHAPKDVIMPAIGKMPVHRHRGGDWCWTKWKQVRNTLRPQDICVLLQTLCVIDVDSEEQAVELEKLFGDVLSRCPQEKTANGRH